MNEPRLFRRTPIWLRKPIRTGTNAQADTVLVTGATGFIGRHVCRRMIERGHRVIALVRDLARAADLYGPHVEAVVRLADIPADRRIDVIVNLAGAPIMGARWKVQRPGLLLESRLRITDEVVTLIARLSCKPRVLISASAVGYYGVRGDEEVTEAERGQPVFQSHLCQAWELAAQTAEVHGVRVCRLRFGVVLGRESGAWPQLTRAGNLGVRLVLGSGRQWLSWIHIRDAVRLLEFCIERGDIHGAINATAPQPVRQEEFARLTTRAHAIRAQVPERFLCLLLGEAAQLLLDGQRVVPMKARCAGFEFRYATLEAAIRDLRARSRPSARRVQIVYDQSCPICELEMQHYRRYAKKLGLPWRFDDIGERPDVMARYLVDRVMARQRLYVLDEHGVMLSGMEALLVIWSSLPRRRWLARLLSVAPLRSLANSTYDLVLAPLVHRWNERRRSLAAIRAS